MIDKVLGHYWIVSKLGEGGMGVVYRARDQVLQRDVALKFIGAALAPEARQLLLREARAASALSHPNICTVHEVGEADGEFLYRHGIDRGQAAERLHRQRRPAIRISDALRRPDRRRPGACPWAQHRPSRPEELQSNRVSQGRFANWE